MPRIDRIEVLGARATAGRSTTSKPGPDTGGHLDRARNAPLTSHTVRGGREAMSVRDTDMAVDGARCIEPIRHAKNRALPLTRSDERPWDQSACHLTAP